MTGQEKGDLSIQVTSRTDLTLMVFLDYVIPLPHLLYQMFFISS